MRIGLFGGTFNPVHNGHLAMVRGVRQEFALDRIHLILAAVPPHKATRDLAPVRDRLKMLQMATQREAHVHVSEIELQRRGPSFTIDTVDHMKARLANNATLFLIVGMDAFMEIDTWKAYRRLFAQVAMIVLPRTAPAMAAATDDIATVVRFLHAKVSRQFHRTAGERRLQHPRLQAVYLSNLPPVDISATAVRERVKRHGVISDLVPATVADYIFDNGLYR